MLPRRRTGTPCRALSLVAVDPVGADEHRGPALFGHHPVILAYGWLTLGITGMTVWGLPLIEPSLFVSQTGSTVNVVGYQSVHAEGGSRRAGRYSLVRVAAIGISISVQFDPDRLCQRWNVPLWVRKSPALIVISYTLPSSPG